MGIRNFKPSNKTLIQGVIMEANTKQAKPSLKRRKILIGAGVIFGLLLITNPSQNSLDSKLSAEFASRDFYNPIGYIKRTYMGSSVSSFLVFSIGEGTYMTQSNLAFINGSGKTHKYYGFLGNWYDFSIKEESSTKK